jgi:macrolide-specific efflux system membrane fusion protein
LCTAIVVTQQGKTLKKLFARVRRRTWIIVGAVVVVLGVAAGVVFGVVLPGNSASADTIETTATASLETLEQSVLAGGTLTPLVDEDVSWAGSGTVLSVAVEEGTVVEKGDPLGTIDTLQLNADLLDAKVTLADAQARLADDSSTSAELAANQAAVAVAQKAVNDAADALAGATLVAPVAGVVTSVAVVPGDSVGSSGGMDSGTSAAFRITGTDAWEVDVTLGETDIALIEKGDQVELSTDDGVDFFGTVSTIGLLPDTSSGAAAYPVTIAVTGTAEGLFDGMSATASIVYERRTDVLTVPSAAVTTGQDGTSTVTVIGEDGTRTETTVTVGETAGTLTEITEGLSEGDEVLVASFTPGEGNQGGSFPGGIVIDGDTFPGGGTFPEGGQGGGPQFGGNGPQG